MITHELSREIANYVLGGLLTSGIITLWFFSNLPIHLCKILRLIRSEDEVYTWDDWQLWASAKTSIFWELFSCPLCLGVWVSLAVSGSLIYLNTLSLWFMATAVLSWPVMIYYFYNKFSNGKG